MSTIDRVLVILKEKNLRQKDLTDYLGISKNAFTDWKSGRIQSWQKYLPQIAEFLGVSVDELLGVMPSVAYLPLTLAQKRVVELLPQLDELDCVRLEGMIRLMLSDDKYKKITALSDGS